MDSTLSSISQLKGAFSFFSLIFYLLKPLTSLEEALLHPSEREEKWDCSHFQEHPPR